MGSKRHTRGGSFVGAVKVNDTHVPERSANDVLSAVMSGIGTYGTKSVTAVGHSLGAALSLLEAMFLPLHISGLTVTYYGYGLPRVRTSTRASSIGTLERLTLPSHRSEIELLPTTSTVNSTAGSLASQTSRTPFRSFPVDSWVSSILLAKLTLTMGRSGSGVLARTILMLSVVLEIPLTSSFLTPATTLALTMVSRLVVKLFLIFQKIPGSRFAPFYRNNAGFRMHRNSGYNFSVFHPRGERSFVATVLSPVPQ